ncbi:polymorphic toxin-type HINT domain-containing protein [Streptomyces edwardsiae]|uniref:Polymorphic toxin-type HINT domain-containing protein n=1 Tax=Streptomyces edwardsiae TaxID=3075527 RepID=A0ABU2QHD6_9ACTN|nr:polymorphic toxin-type HINT domain-containing protein [Streptomyces sp. DSM 41635]MDT0403887.1 polymorphic toxin-type HINT domain-containing protein [Streptomyces sp. DSM 41635]
MNGRQRTRVRALRRRVALASATVVIGTLLQAVVQPASVAADRGTGRPDLAAAEQPVEVSAVPVVPRTLAKGSHTPAKAPRATWPLAGTATVDPPESSSSVVQAKGLPLAVGGKQAPESVRARLFDRETAVRAGADGLVFSLEADGPVAAARKRGTAVRARLDYSSIAEAFGGGYAGRLRLVELPACALTTPDKDICREATPLDAVNDTEAKTLTAPSVSLKASGATVLAAVADDASMGGDYKATPLSPSAQWSTSLNTGDFAWSYGMNVPDVPGGLLPSVGMSYSSGSIDGRSGNSNNQGSWVGDGFDMWPGFIERRYKSCADDGVEHADGGKPADLCWAYDNAFISFNGKGGELVPDGTDTFRLRDDDGTKVQRLRGSSSDVRSNGARDDEYWKVTTPDGVQYYFGYNRLPGWTDGKETTDSTWTAPVFGDDAGEPCHASAFADSWCRQGWRWNLDYVVDPHGNAIAYYYDKEWNSYGRNLDEKANTRYVRGGSLDRIEYGLRSTGMYSARPLAKVDFTSGERCLPDADTTCADIGKDAFYWYDTPWDLNCDESATCDEGRLSPVFFTRMRLTSVATQVLKSGSYADVDSWKLVHRWGTADTDYQLLLDSVQRTGHSTTPAATLPKTTFGYKQLANRLDRTGDGFAPFIKDRLATVADESGGQIDVDYSAPVCDAGALPAPQTNTTRCFPQYIGGSSTDDPELHWFNKYVTSTVTLTDRTGGAPDQVTSYEYLGGAAWHYDDDDGLTKEKEKTWSQWRGYGHVRVKAGGQGGAEAMKSQADTYFLRGMDGDRLAAGGGTKAVDVTLGSGEGDPITDHESAAGFAYKTVQYSGPGGRVLGKTVNRPWHHETAKKVRSWGTVTANLTGTAQERSWTSLDDGAGTKWRTTTVNNSFDTVAGRITRTDDRGDDATTADDRCTRTSYPAAGAILTLPARAETVAVNCAGTPDRTEDVIADLRTAYDGRAYDAAPAKGDATATAVLKSHDGTTATYTESGATYDAYGRELTNTDLTGTVKVTVASDSLTRTARTDGLTTTTAYTPTTGFPTSAKVTTPPATPGDSSTAQSTITTNDPARGVPLTQTDTNGKVTSFAYDALGRTTKVWLADRRTSDVPTYEYTYKVTGDDPVAVGTRIIGDNNAQITSYVLYDGSLRPRQSQTPGPDGGRLLSDTFYDERGLTVKEFLPYYATSVPSTTLVEPEDALSVETQNRYTHDGLGRQTEHRQIFGNGDGGKVLNATRTLYGGDRITVIPPEGGTATTTLTDARGQTTELRQHHQRAAEASYDTTRYTFNPAGALSGVTDPAGNEWAFAYDPLGRMTRSDDPDKGTSRYTYDDRGRLTSTVDARDTTLVNVYDGLGRKTELRSGSTTGPLHAKWTYDTVSGAKGHLAQSTRYADGGLAYTSEVVAYDRLYRPLRTSVTIPESDANTGLSGTYLSGTSYKGSGLVAAVGLPKAGSLTASTVAFEYEDDTLRPIAVDGREGLKATASYSLTGKPLQYELSDSGGKKAWVTNEYEPGTQRLSFTRVDRQDVAGVDQASTFRYDEAGNVLAVSDTSRSGTDTQCFTYDHLRRMREAWTQPTAACASTPDASVLGGPVPYWTSYGYDKTGNRSTEVQHDTTGDTTKNVTSTYDYPAPGATAVRPHGLETVTRTGPGVTAGDSYTYDATGNTDTRTLGNGTTQNLDWDAEGRLTKVTEPVEGGSPKVTEYVHDADGNRLIARTPTETTLYLGGTEITVAKGSATPKGTRYIDLGGGHTAVQEDDGTVFFTTADHHGTALLAIDAATQKLTQRRTSPFGGTRGEEPADWPGTKGFVGGTQDVSTGLTHLGAREYDPSTGRFLSVDPIMDLTDPQQINGYTYSNNNPLTFSDPSGLYCDGCSVNNPDSVWAPSKGNGPGCTTYTCYDHDGNVDYRVGRSGTSKQSTSSPTVTVKVTEKEGGIFIENIRVPTARELAAMFPQYEGEKQLEAWAERKCFQMDAGLDAFCGAAEALGIINYEQTLFEKIVVSLVTPDFDAWKSCLSGDSLTACGWAATDLPWARVFKGLKVVKAADPPCNSFAPGTEVLMADGTTKPIEDVEIGDKVLATDPVTGRTETETVTAEILGEGPKALVTLTLTIDGEQVGVTATDGHPFWVPGLDAWVDAGELTIGQELRTAAGQRVAIADIDRWSQPARVHNLTVTDSHTYYVLAGQTPVLVHNSGGCPDLDALSQSGMRPAKGNTTHAGREYQKHMNRGDLPVVPGKQLKSAGQDMLDDILTNPGTVTSPVNSGNFAGGTRYIMPDPAGGRGIGATFDANGQFQYFGRY